MTDLLLKLAVAGVLALALGLWWKGWRDRQASVDWPFVQGVIVQSDTVRATADPHEAQSTASWRLLLRYRYEVHGQVHTGDRLRAMARFYPQEADAREALKPYPVGAAVRVYHDPARPSSSVLQPG